MSMLREPSPGRGGAEPEEEDGVPAPVVEIFCDGACSGNPGVGGFGSILRYGGREKEISGAAGETTNNRMEMTAAITAMESLKRP